MNCVFCKIIKGELPSYKVSENEHFFAFLSIGPHRRGHTLIVPKNHIDDFFEMDEALQTKIILFAKPIVDALKRAFNPKSGKVGLVVAGLEVPHAHLHLIPMDELGDLDFNKAREVSSEELEEVLKILKEALD